ncbi:PAN domain-containing protein [Chitinimonas sp.]|uniref:PAN domain-containing protein n=1 Tax=Chitinimonas sp. TaxID=1934313 RepID=UPI0035AF13AF
MQTSLSITRPSRHTPAVLLALLGSIALALPLDYFDRSANAAIAGHNTEHLQQVAPADCATACLDASRSSWCVSFDYDKLKQACDLSDVRASDVGGLKTDYPGNPYDHYSLRPALLKQFSLSRDAAIAGHNTEQLRNASPSDCAAACTALPRRAWCRSFDYYKAQQACDLSDVRASDVGGLKTDYPGNPYDHYSLIAGEGRPNPLPGDKHVLLIGIDGLRGDSIACQGCAPLTALPALIASGAFHANVLAGGSQPTVSGPGWASVFTGFWADQHGVVSNDASLPLQRPHVFDLIKQQYPDATVAVVGDWFNISHNLAPRQADFIEVNAPKNSQQASDAVKRMLGWRHAPSAIFYYLHNVDIHAASYAPLHPYYQSKISAEDQQIAQVLAALVARPNYLNEEWLIVVTSDHGGLNSGHGGQSAAERNSFLILNNHYLNPGKPAYCSGDLSSAPLSQVDGATPHILDFLGLPNHSAGHTHPACGFRRAR